MGIKTCSYYLSSAPTCEVKYERVGCFNDNHRNPRPLPELILTDRDTTSDIYSKQNIDWGDFDNYMRDFACRCARAAKNKRFFYFGLQHYGNFVIIIYTFISKNVSMLFSQKTYNLLETV